MSIEIHGIFANRKTNNEILLFVDAHDKVEKKMFYVTPYFNERELYTTDEGQAMCTITDDMAKILMDRLWETGIRPS